MKLTLGQAAKECGRSKATLSKAIKSGRLSVAAKTSAGFEIDPAELFRVFPKEAFAANETNDQKRFDSHELIADLSERLGRTNAEKQALEEQISLLREMVDRANATVSKAELNADEWRKQAQTLALSHEKGTKQTASFWTRLFGRAA